MKTKILSLLAFLALIVFSACDDHNYGSEIDGLGSISFANFGVSVEESQAVVGSRASQKVDVSDYLVSITNKSTQRRVFYKKYSEVPGVLDLTPGTYVIKVESHNVQKAEFEHPYYLGSSEVTVEENKITDAGTIECKFASVRVSINYSDKLRPLLGNDVKVVVTCNDGGMLEFLRDETRSGYFEAVTGSTTLIAKISGTVNGVLLPDDNSTTEVLTDVKAGVHYTIVFKVKGIQDAPDETGNIDPGEGISIDTSVVSDDKSGNVNPGEDPIESGDRPGKEDPLPDDPNNPDNPDDPTPPADNDAIIVTSAGGVIDFDAVNDALDGRDYTVHIEAPNKLKDIKVEIKSDYLTEDFLKSVGLTTTFSLAYPGEYEEALIEFEFPVKDGVIGQSGVDFNLSPFIPLLNLSPEPMVHVFVMTIIDQNDNTVVKNLKFQSF